MRRLNYVISVAIFLAGLTVATEVAQAQEETATDATTAPQSKIGVGARFRYVFMPQAVLDLFVDHSTSMGSFGFGAEVVRRKGDFDIVFGIEYDSISPDDGLYLDAGDDPNGCTFANGMCPDFMRFDGLGLLGLDVSFLWHYAFNPNFQLRYGAGIGVGFVLGAMYHTDAASCAAGTTPDDLDNTSACQPVPGPGAGIQYDEKEDDVPPVVPIVNVQLGARYKVNDNLSFNIEGGFRDVFFFGLGTDYIF